MPHIRESRYEVLRLSFKVLRMLISATRLTSSPAMKIQLRLAQGPDAL